MKFSVKSILYSIDLYKVKKFETFNPNKIENELEKFKIVLDKSIIEITKFLEYNILKKENKYMITNNYIKAILEYKVDYIKKNTLYHPKVEIIMEFDEIVTANELLLLDFIFKILQKATKKFYHWEIKYVGQTNQKYDIVENGTLIKVKEIEVTQKIENANMIEDFLTKIVIEHLEKNRIMKQYELKKQILNELQDETINIVKKLCSTRRKKIKIKDGTISIKQTNFSFLDSVYASPKGNVIMKDESYYIQRNTINNARIYEVINKTEKRKEKYCCFYVIDLEYKKNVYKDFYNLKYMRVYTTRKISLIELEDIIEEQKKMNKEIIW